MSLRGLDTNSLSTSGLFGMGAGVGEGVGTLLSQPFKVVRSIYKQTVSAHLVLKIKSDHLRGRAKFTDNWSSRLHCTHNKRDGEW